VNAEISMIPSRPMLITPARSEINAPSDGSKIGVVTRKIDARNAALKMPSSTL